jgi:hypothetical protein
MSALKSLYVFPYLCIKQAKEIAVSKTNEWLDIQ